MNLRSVLRIQDRVGLVEGADEFFKVFFDGGLGG